MWHKEYRDYKTDQPLIKCPVESSHGIVGCEMHEINGWGNTLQAPKVKKRGFLASLIIYLFSSKKEANK